MTTEMIDNTKTCPVVIACRIMEPELERVRQVDNQTEIRYLDQGLHRTPEKMPRLVQEQIEQASSYATQIVLGYGLCSNGLVGVKARQQRLIIPRCHDCIALFLGSPGTYKRAFEARPGTYYLTPGWIAEKKDPLGIVEEEYTTRFDRDTAIWVMEEELKHYTHIALIDTGVTDLGPLRIRALENARLFKKEYEEIRGSLEYFTKMIHGPYPDEDFLIFGLGEQVAQGVFLEEASATAE